MQPYSMYIHIPFCQHRCAYCDFNTYAGLSHLVSDYVAALCAEVKWLASTSEQRLTVHTVFFGGGTPSLLPIPDIEAILQTVKEAFDLTPDAEITLEANPGTVSFEYLEDLRGTGVNRLSLGLQSANQDELRLLERQHDFGDAVQAVQWAKQAGFDNINLDLIYGLPYQTVDRWERTVESVLELQVEHLSLYALTLEHGTPMHQWVRRGLLPEPDADLAADMYDLAGERLEQSGYSQYEISNWAAKGEGGNIQACRHNLQYWRLLPYFGLGAGGHGFVFGTHTANVLSPGVYIKRLRNAQRAQRFPRTPATTVLDRVSLREEMGEVMIMGLRLVQEGIADETFRRRFGMGLAEAYGAQIEKLVARDMLEWRDNSLRLTYKARLLANQVFLEFVGD